MRLWSLKVNDRRNVGGKLLTRCFYMPGIFSSYIRRWNLEGNKIFRSQGHTLHPQRTLRRRPPQNVRPILYDYYYHYSSCNMHANTHTQINTHTQVRANTYFSKSWNACGCLNVEHTYSCAFYFLGIDPHVTVQYCCFCTSEHFGTDLIYDNMSWL